MPFTPFHLGPAFALGLPLRRRIHFFTFVLTNVIVDVEPFLVLVLGLSYPLHGFLHTFLLGEIFCLLVSLLMFKLESFLISFYRLILPQYESPKLKCYLASGLIGGFLHILLDSPMYSEMMPLFPLKINPLYNPTLTKPIYTICTLLGLIGIAYYIAIFIRLK